MDYIVSGPVVVNGVHRNRGERLTGDDARAVDDNNPQIMRQLIHVASLSQPASQAPVSRSSEDTK